MIILQRICKTTKNKGLNKHILYMSSREEAGLEDDTDAYYKRPQVVRYIQLLKEYLFGKDELNDIENGFMYYILRPVRAREIDGVSYAERDTGNRPILDEPTIDAVIKRLDSDNVFYSLSDYFSGHSGSMPSTVEDLLTNLKVLKIEIVESLNADPSLKPSFFIQVKTTIMGKYIYSEPLLKTIKKICEALKLANDELCIFDIYFEVLLHCYEVILKSLDIEYALQELDSMRNSGRLYKINIDYELNQATKTHLEQIIKDKIKDRDRQLENASRMLFGGKRMVTRRKKTKTRKTRITKRRVMKRRVTKKQK